MPRRPVTIEFVGLPASGKSALTDRLIDSLSRQGVEIVPFRKLRWPEYLPGVGRKLLANPRPTGAALGAIFAVNDAKVRKTRRRTCRWWCSPRWWKDYARLFSKWFGWQEWQPRTASAGDIAISQPCEFILQLTWRLLFWLPVDQAQKVFGRIRDQIPVSDVVIIVGIDPMAVARRLDNADRPPGLGRINRELRKERDNIPFLRERFGYIDWIADFVRNHPSKPLIIDVRTDGEDDADASAAKLSDTILQHLRQQVEKGDAGASHQACG